jgi:hypothetical protein
VAGQVHSIRSSVPAQRCSVVGDEPGTPLVNDPAACGHHGTHDAITHAHRRTADGAERRGPGGCGVAEVRRGRWQRVLRGRVRGEHAHASIILPRGARAVDPRRRRGHLQLRLGPVPPSTGGTTLDGRHNPRPGRSRHRVGDPRRVLGGTPPVASYTGAPTSGPSGARSTTGRRRAGVAPLRTCGAARSARRPVKPEVAGSNPVRSATVRSATRPGPVRPVAWSARSGSSVGRARA